MIVLKNAFQIFCRSKYERHSKNSPRRKYEIIFMSLVRQIFLKDLWVENNKCGYIKIEKMCLSKNIIKKMKKTNSKWVSISSICMSNKSSYLEYKKQERQFNREKNRHLTNI